MRIGIVGIGHVAQALGRRFAEVGHQVLYGVRDPDNEERRAQAHELGGELGSVQHVAEADVILLAVPWLAVADVLETLGDLPGKVVLDCTNPVNSDLTGLTVTGNDSAGETVARLVPQARVVKIFNTNGSTNMADADYGPHPVSMFYAGEADDANRLAAGLAAEIGFEPIWLGGLQESRLLEALAMTWILLARHRGFGRDFALDVVRRQAMAGLSV